MASSTKMSGYEFENNFWVYSAVAHPLSAFDKGPTHTSRNSSFEAISQRVKDGIKATQGLATFFQNR